MDSELCKDYGIDYARGLKNCMGNLTFYKKIMSMFLRDQCFPQARAAYRRGDLRELFELMHELKGISGNAALTELYDAAVPLVELLRVSDAPGPELERLFTAVELAYLRTCQGAALIIAE